MDGKTFMLICLTLLIFSCQQNDGIYQNCPANVEVLDEIKVDEHYLITTDGKLYQQFDEDCQFIMQYFDPAFAGHYFNQDGKIFLQEDGFTIETFTLLFDDFENAQQFTDLFIADESTLDRQWNAFVLQGPANPTVAEYVSLRKCILNSTCDFEDNRIDIVTDVEGNIGQCLKFSALAPSATMVTSKSSIESNLMHADIDDEVYLEGDFYIAEGFPFSLIDFENKWFDQSPGIRLVFDREQYLSAELKYGSKPWFRQPAGSETIFPVQQWVQVKAYVLLKNDTSGIVKIWQDGQLIVDARGQTLPTSNSIQTSIETGITATSKKTVLYLDNFEVRIERN